MASGLLNGNANLQCCAMLSIKQCRSQSSMTYGIVFRNCFQSDASRTFLSFLSYKQCNSFKVPSNYCNGTKKMPVLSCLQGNVTKYFDFIVVGSGVAGLRYALEVSKHGSVAIITKAEPHECNTNYAQGGVSAVLCPSDSVESHMQDTIVAGGYLCDEETVRVSYFWQCF